jgi:NAD(P)-dependent dehydrogenase (short-subunit alcohol dehydrogenase family)
MTFSICQVAVLLNNAAIDPESKSWELLDNWRSTFEVNLFGYAHPPRWKRGFFI